MLMIVLESKVVVSSEWNWMNDDNSMNGLDVNLYGQQTGRSGYEGSASSG